MRRQGSWCLVMLLSGVARRDPDFVLECGQGELVVALTSVPMVLEAACRWRVATPEEMNAFCRAWGRARALLVVDPLVMPTHGGDVP